MQFSKNGILIVFSMDFVSDLRDATLDAASAIGFAAKGMGEKLSQYTEGLGDQMHIIGSHVGHELSLVAGDIGHSVGNLAGKIGSNVSSILARAFNDFVRLVAACETHEVCPYRYVGNCCRRRTL